MSATPEYNTLISLTGELRCAVQSNLVPLSDSLKAEYLISPENASQLRNPMHPEAERAAKLVDIIQNKVQQNAQHYHTFVRVLDSQGREYYRDILSRLHEVYRQCSDNSQQPVPLSQAPGPTSVSGSDYSNIKQRRSHRTGIFFICHIKVDIDVDFSFTSEPDDGNAGVEINSGARLSRQDSQSNSTIHTSQLWCYLLKGMLSLLYVAIIINFFL